LEDKYSVALHQNSFMSNKNYCSTIEEVKGVIEEMLLNIQIDEPMNITLTKYSPDI
jgi:hypothetical protein